MNVIRQLALALSLACLATPSFSQNRFDRAATADDLSQAVSPGQELPQVKAAIRASLTVRIAEVNRPESRVLSLPARPRPRPRPSQSQARGGWIKRHPKLFGALVGFGVGCPIGAAQVGGSQDDFFNAFDELACPFLGGVGAAAGAAIGAAVSR
jgi:hypothetical protein